MSLDFWLVGLGFCGFGDVSFWANALFGMRKCVFDMVKLFLGGNVCLSAFAFF